MGDLNGCMKGGSVPIVDLEGTPYEIGLKHGRSLRTQILSQLEIYKDIFQVAVKFDWTRVRSVAKEYEGTIRALAPHLLEEMRGIAEGVGAPDAVDLLDIVALNARSEIALGQWDDGCTSLSWKLDGGKQLLAQNWDWRTAVGQNLALMSIKQAGKPDIWMVTEAGIVGKIGFNSASVGVCLNAIKAKPVNTSLLPIHLLLRIALENTSAESAIAHMESLGGASSTQHILIADQHGGIGLELSPNGGVYIKEDENGMVTHTNHLLANNLVEERAWLTGSPVRLDRARVLCSDLSSKLGAKNLTQKLTPALLRQKIFADTFNSPQSICGVPDPDRAESVETLFNIIMTFEPNKPPRAEVLFGRPASSTGEVYTLPW